MSLHVEESEYVKATLREWAQGSNNNKLSQVNLSNDGSSLVWNDPSAGGAGAGAGAVSLPGHVMLVVTGAGGDKQCQYTAASIFLQIRDPHQGLLPYRSVCKKHQVQDPVKALDKPMILSYFLGWQEEVTEPPPPPAGSAQQQQQQQPFLEGVSQQQLSQPTVDDAAALGLPEQPAAVTTETAVIDSQEPSPSKKSSSSSRHHSKDRSHHKDQKHRDQRHNKDRHGHRSHSEREHKEHRSSSSGSKRHSSAPDGVSASKRHKSSATSSGTPSSKSSKPMTNEQLFSNLNVVVDKRQQLQHEQEHRDDDDDGEEERTEAMAIHHALSAEGFQVTPDLLAQYQETSQWIAAREIPVGNSASILRATAGRDLKRVLEIFLEATNQANRPNAAAAAAAGKNKPHAGGAAGKSKPTSIPPAPPGTKPVNTYLIGKRPIIVVPKAMSAPITMVNAHEFFANAKFVPRDVMLKQLQQPSNSGNSSSSGQRRGAPPNTFCRRVSSRWLTAAAAITAAKAAAVASSSSSAALLANLNHSNNSLGLLEFEIMDNPTSKLGLDNVREWQRIVAVVSLGQAWQFKDWPGPYGQAVSLFGERVYGCYIGLEGDSIPSDLLKWNVRKSKLSRDKRSLDTVTHANFWNELEEWIAIHKPELLPQPPAGTNI